MKEIWESVNGYNGDYEVSNIGRIRSWKKWGGPSPRIKKTPTDSYGYLVVGLCKDGVLKTLKVARLVAIAFIDNPENKPQVNHIDGNKENNVVSNLEWSTAGENVNHAFSNGLASGIKGEKNSSSVLKRRDVIKIREIWSNTNKRQYEIADMYNISQGHVSDIVNKKKWAHV